MFTVNAQSIYSDGAMSALEQALSSVRTINAFTDPSILSALRSETLKSLETGEKKTLKGICAEFVNKFHFKNYRPQSFVNLSVLV